MQLSGDYQIREHSQFSSMKQALIQVIYSFAEHAPFETKLVIKNHPLDSGQKNYGKLVKNIGKELGISNRLVYLDGGNLPELLDHSTGIITINSTAGLQAIHHKKPTKVLGIAIYDHPKLVNSCPLENFWHELILPNDKAYQRFRNFLLKETQLNGSFYDPVGINILIPSMTEKLLAF
jgi:capsular polysaccharide export protein